MRQYLKIYFRLLKMNFALMTTYRAHFVNSVISTCGWGLFQISWISLLTYRTKSVFGWSRNELILLSVSYTIVIAIFHFLFSRNFERLARTIDKGELDTFLLKPIDSQFTVSCWNIRFANIIRVFMGFGFLFFLLPKMKISISLINIVSFAILTFFGLTLLYSLWFIISTIIIWFPTLDNLMDFLFTINGMARYPTQMIKSMPAYLLPVLLPFAITVVTPTQALFGKALNGDIIFLLILSVVLFFFSRIFWRFSLRYYTSASS